MASIDGATGMHFICSRCSDSGCRAASVVLELGLLASGALIDAVEAHVEGTTAMLDDLLARGLADRAYRTVLTNKTSHGRDGSGENPLLSFALNIAFLDAIHGLLIHDNNVGAAYELNVHGVGESPGFEHGFPRLEDHVLVFHGRHPSIKAKSTERHASLSTRGTAQRWKIIGVAIRPALGVVNDINQALLWVHDAQHQQQPRVGDSDVFFFGGVFGSLSGPYTVAMDSIRSNGGGLIVAEDGVAGPDWGLGALDSTPLCSLSCAIRNDGRMVTGYSPRGSRVVTGDSGWSSGDTLDNRSIARGYILRGSISLTIYVILLYAGCYTNSQQQGSSSSAGLMIWTVGTQ